MQAEWTERDGIVSNTKEEAHYERRNTRFASDKIIAHLMLIESLSLCQFFHYFPELFRQTHLHLVDDLVGNLLIICLRDTTGNARERV